MDSVSNFIYFDGGVHGQRVCVHDIEVDKYIVKTIKEGKTNNELEYWALIIAIRYANRNYNSKHIVVFTGDSRLIINQVWGRWRINKERLWILHKIVMKELKKAKYEPLGEWIRRDENIAGIRLEKLMKSDKNV